jgi:hypothetical protein
MDGLKAPEYTKSIKSGDMEIFFRPMTYQQLTSNSQIQYENQKLLQLIPDTDMVEADKMSALGASLKKITTTTMALSFCMVQIPWLIQQVP